MQIHTVKPQDFMLASSEDEKLFFGMALSMQNDVMFDGKKASIDFYIFSIFKKNIFGI